MAIYVLVASSTKRSTGPASRSVEVNSPRELLQAAELFGRSMSTDGSVEIWAVNDYMGTYTAGKLDITSGSRLSTVIVDVDPVLGPPGTVGSDPYPQPVKTPWVPDSASILRKAEDLKPGDVFWALNRPLTVLRFDPGQFPDEVQIVFRDEHGGEDVYVCHAKAEFYTKPRAD